MLTIMWLYYHLPDAFNCVAFRMPGPVRFWQAESMKNGSPEELDFAYDEDFAVFAFGRGRRTQLRRKSRLKRKRVRQLKGRRAEK